jgi:hypothetical protein
MLPIFSCLLWQYYSTKNQKSQGKSAKLYMTIIEGSARDQSDGDCAFVHDIVFEDFL